MVTVPLYEADAYRRTCEAEVLATGVDDGGPWAVLSQTVLYPEGGGQPADRGWLDEVAVVDVRKVADGIRHTLERPLDARVVRVTVDWPRRFDHMQQHTAQHLLTAIAADRFGWPTTAFHLGERVSDVELDVRALSQTDREALEEAVAQEVRAARAVTTRHVTAAALAALAGVRSRGLPDDHTGEVRLVEIAGLDCNTCGGTHVASTSELEAVALLGTEPMRGGTRLFFVAGGRLRRRLAAHESRNAALRTALGAADDELPAAVTARLAAQHALTRRLERTETELAEVHGALLATVEAPLVEAHFEGRELPFLKRLAQALLAAAPAKVVFLSAQGEGSAFFLLAAGPDRQLDLPTLGAGVAHCLGGRGGGSGLVFQGKAPTLDGRAAALAWLRSTLEGEG